MDVSTDLNFITVLKNMFYHVETNQQTKFHLHSIEDFSKFTHFANTTMLYEAASWVIG